MSEIEAKFLIDDSAQVPQVLGALGLGDAELMPVGTVDVCDRYLDTHDWRVLQAGWTYRWRDEAGKRKVTLKSVTTNGELLYKREEIEQSITAFPAHGHPVPEGRIAERLGKVGRKRLRELFEVRNHRQLYQVRTDVGALIEIAIDHAAITALAPTKKPAPGHLEFDELEMELKEGTEESLRTLAETIRRQFRLLPSHLSKFERGLQTVGLTPPLAQLTKEARWLEEADFVRRLRTRPLRVDDPVAKLAYRYLLDRYETVLRHEPQAWEGLEPEGVHQMRVATRKIRAAFRSFKDVFPSASRKHFGREFKWVAAALGGVRDTDVYKGNFPYCMAELPQEDQIFLADCRQHIFDQWQLRRSELLECLNSDRYEQLKRGFAELLQHGLSSAEPQSAPSLTIGDASRKTIRKQYNKVVRNGRVIKRDSPDEALHTLRIDCKRLRYLFEFFRPIHGSSLNRFIKRLKKLQDVLGEFQDTRVATQQLRAHAQGVPMQPENRGQLIAIGQLIHVQHNLAAARRSDFFNVWKRFDRKGQDKKVLSKLS